jgi:FlaA1/EpsC-like NDP-sugar epimerase
MTPTEAVSLVLQAGGFGTSGELYLLDMGEPFRITRLAENMIKSYGLEPYTGISIVFSGVRPGEKLTETLIANNEEFKPTSDKRILLVVKPDMFDNDEFSKILHRLRYKADCTTGAETREALCEVVESITQRRIMK